MLISPLDPHLPPPPLHHHHGDVAVVVVVVTVGIVMIIELLLLLSFFVVVYVEGRHFLRLQAQIDLFLLYILSCLLSWYVVVPVT